jgi:hypothetical protein
VIWKKISGLMAMNYIRILLQGYLDSRKEDEIEGECLGIDEENTGGKIPKRQLEEIAQKSARDERTIL